MLVFHLILKVMRAVTVEGYIEQSLLHYIRVVIISSKSTKYRQAFSNSRSTAIRRLLGHTYVSLKFEYSTYKVQLCFETYD